MNKPYYFNHLVDGFSSVRAHHNFTGAENTPAHCDFEEGICSLQHVTDNVDFNWERAKGGTGSYGTGPDKDHTTNSAEGYFIYTEASYPRRQVMISHSMSHDVF